MATETSVQLRVITFNVCWGCVSDDAHNKDKTPMARPPNCNVAKSKRPSCRASALAFIEGQMTDVRMEGGRTKPSVDIIALQECDDEFLGLLGPLKVKHAYKLLFHKSKKENAVLFLKSGIEPLDSVGADATFNSNHETGRPIMAALCKLANGAHFTVVNAHCAHGLTAKALSDVLGFCISNLATKAHSDMLPIICAGDWNDYRGGNFWEGLSITVGKTRRNLFAGHSGLQGPAESVPRSCCLPGALKYPGDYVMCSEDVIWIKANKAILQQRSSDHVPVTCTVQIGGIAAQHFGIAERVVRKKRPAPALVSDEDWAELLDRFLPKSTTFASPSPPGDLPLRPAGLQSLGDEPSKLSTEKVLAMRPKSMLQPLPSESGPLISVQSPRGRTFERPEMSTRFTAGEVTSKRLPKTPMESTIPLPKMQVHAASREVTFSTPHGSKVLVPSEIDLVPKSRGAALLGTHERSTTALPPIALPVAGIPIDDDEFKDIPEATGAPKRPHFLQTGSVPGEEASHDEFYDPLSSVGDINVVSFKLPDYAQCLLKEYREYLEMVKKNVTSEPLHIVIDALMADSDRACKSYDVNKDLPIARKNEQRSLIIRLIKTVLPNDFDQFLKEHKLS